MRPPSTDAVTSAFATPGPCTVSSGIPSFTICRTSASATRAFTCADVRGATRLAASLNEQQELAHLFRDLATLRAEPAPFRDVDELRNSLVDPDAAVVVGFVKTRVTTADGTTLTGVRLNEDSFSIQIRDTSNKFHSFWKSELRQIEKELDRSLMPSFRDTLSADEREDVVSYLISLGPKQ